MPLLAVVRSCKRTYGRWFCAWNIDRQWPSELLVADRHSYTRWRSGTWRSESGSNRV